MTAPFKFYYLQVLAFWLHQVFVLGSEEPRKDFYEMAIHHVVTIGLVIGSYWCHLTRVGHAIMCVMDISDIFLSVTISIFHVESITFLGCKNGQLYANGNARKRAVLHFFSIVDIISLLLLLDDSHVRFL